MPAPSALRLRLSSCPTLLFALPRSHVPPPVPSSLPRFFSTTHSAATSSTAEPLISIASATISRQVPGSGVPRPIFRDLDWRVEEHQRWAVVGPVGSGKSSLGELLVGRHHVSPPESVAFPALEEEVMGGSQPFRLVSFKEDSGLFSYSKHYYQERYHWTDAWTDVSLRSFLEAGLPEGAGTQNRVEQVAKRMGIAGLLAMSFLKMSNGQVRRARIARAVLVGARVVVLDEPFMGLDPPNRLDVSSLLGSLTDPSASPPLHVLLLLRPQDPLPEWITHVLVLDAMRVAWRGERAGYVAAFPENHQDAAVTGRDASPVSISRARRESREQLPDVVKMENVRVSYSGVPILRDVDWSVKRGDRWALVGANGSGKSTLLSLITGDNPQSYANRISLFGVPRGSGESIWEIKTRIGLVSPEVHFYFHEPMPAERVVAMGLPAGTPKEEGEERVQRIMREFEQEHVKGRMWAHLSVGEQRVLLLMRSLISDPELIIWDEPFQGLDPSLVSLVNKWIERHLREDQTLIFVTHSEEEMPAVVDRRLRLDQGMVVEVV
ncbi:P-loop containing nucleoside triphosphate hydrolase protein [Gonapodya prolifera JEL478]|uniref:p-loop containing nucleoside triphosphate hydrolase protein n=1 Tax=Gonapodya prolifera (strain JEL478) TaxID=1344416 RepID=A0A139A3B7_GONPJ|nr:P-loop containing nucleoside triphosphate hydrolase protein [Gonapodya prolifera JEL478]|eukprot:KXS11261.1 P-loop containing nucleoside triphosphate hydrolase protein [Gonapodya prolifera JEL478]